MDVERGREGGEEIPPKRRATKRKEEARERGKTTKRKQEEEGRGGNTISASHSLEVAHLMGDGAGLRVVLVRPGGSSPEHAAEVDRLRGVSGIHLLENEPLEMANLPSSTAART